MTTAVVRPGPVSGTIRAPPSKSYTHRALVIGYLSGRKFRVQRPLDSDDTRATASALSALGARVVRGPRSWRVLPRRRRRAHGSVDVQCGESGTTLRFVCALAALREGAVRIDGRGRLPARPIDELLDALRDLGADCRRLGRSGLPVEVRGPIHGGHVTLDASQTSQFASALLLALPTLEEDSRLELTGQVVSGPYLEATLAVLKQHKLRIARRGRVFSIPGGQSPTGSGFIVPGDASSAAYFWVAAAVSGGKVRVDGVGAKWPQADLAVLDLLKQSGANVARHTDGATVSAGTPTPFRVDLTDSPDLYPLAGVLAATTPGTSRLDGAQHVVLKESDRRASTARLVRLLGATAVNTPAGLRIRGNSRPRTLHVDRLSDHRLVMSAAVGATAGQGVSTVGDRDAVRKSFPEFWNVLAELSGGGSVE